MLQSLASGAWLTRQRVTLIAACMLVGTLLSLGALAFTAHGTADALGRPLGTDFTNFWSAGRLAVEGKAAAAYDWASHHAVQWRTHGTDGYFPWNYPPVLFLVMAPLATLPYLAALCVWQGATLLGALAAAWSILPLRRTILLALAFPATLVCLGHGQTGFLTATLFAGAIVALPRREALAGVLFGLIAYKPHLGLLVPFALAAGGHWRAIAAAAATVATAIAITLLLWGFPVWQAFFAALPVTGAAVFEANNFAWLQSAFAAVRLWGGSVALAYGVQAAVSIGVLVVTVWVWRSAVPMRLKGAVLLTASLMATPYVVDYDLVVLGMAVAFVAAHGLERGFMPWEKTVLAGAWAVPLVARTAAREIFVPLGFIVLVSLFAVLMRRVRVEQAGTAAEPAPVAVH
jgi:alpha-1,2-mannosyltransferase